MLTHDQYVWPSAKELEILRLLHGESMYGQQIVIRSNKSVQRTAVYTLLERLVDKGFVRVAEEDPRPIYAITPEGRRVLKALDSAASIRAELA